MSKDAKNFIAGIAVGFMGLALYALALKGFEMITIDDIYALAKQLVAPFVITEICTVIGIDGLKSLTTSFKEYVDKLNKKDKKGAEA